MEIHAHEVLKMIAESETGYTRASLIEAIREKFGPDARFATCGGGGLTAEDLVTFIDERGKLAGPADALQLAPGEECSCDTDA
jgi:probable metal-binding protein